MVFLITAWYTHPKPPSPILSSSEKLRVPWEISQRGQQKGDGWALCRRDTWLSGLALVEEGAGDGSSGWREAGLGTGQSSGPEWVWRPGKAGERRVEVEGCNFRGLQDSASKGAEMLLGLGAVVLGGRKGVGGCQDVMMSRARSSCRCVRM
jgi:hypothetical protein